jgi:hypothetical protein
MTSRLDTKALGAKGWRIKAQNRKEWAMKPEK